MVKEDIKQIINSEIGELPEKNVIKKLSLFGSYSKTGEAKTGSDVDLLVEFKPNARVGYFELMKIQEFLKEKLKKNVDLVTPQALSKYFREKVFETAEKIYEG